MDLAGVQCPCMNWEASDLQEQWRRFRQYVELMFSGPLKAKAEEEKISYLLIWVGEQGRDVKDTWTIEAADAKKLETYYSLFEKHVTPKANKVFSRYRFHKREQLDSETFESFVTELKLLVKDCGYHDPDEMVRDRIAFGVTSSRIREKLLNEGSDLTLDKAIQIAKTHEINQSQLQTIKHDKDGGATTTVEAITRRDKGRRYNATPQEYSKRGQDCGKCGRSHEKGCCPAYGKKCRKCSKPNHFEKVCKSDANRGNSGYGRRRNYKTKSDRKVHTVEYADTDDDESLHVDSLETSDNKDQAFANVYVGQNNQKICFKIDTGAQVNAIPKALFLRYFQERGLRKTNMILQGYSGKQLDVAGKCTLRCNHKPGEFKYFDFYVISDLKCSTPVLGLNACLRLRLISLLCAINSPDGRESVKGIDDYADVFQGLGKFPGTHSIQVDPSIPPVVNPPRRVPIALKDKLKVELDRMEELEVVKPVDEPTDWVNSLVVVEKPKTGALRVCLDPKALNKAVKRQHYPIPTFDDVTSKVHGAKYFSILDAKSGYWMVQLDEPSSKLCTFNTPFGRYRFLRLPFGVHSAQEVFQKKMEEVFEGLDGVEVIVDDVLIYGDTPEEHDQRLIAALERCRQRGVKLNMDKCRIKVQSVGYFGNVLTDEGVRPDPKKVSAINEMKAPNCKADLQTVLGMANYMSRFIPNLAEVSAPMRELVKNDSEFIWDKAQEKSFQEMKSLIARDTTLAYYDPKSELTLQVDASQKGLGAAIMQHGRPIAFASKSLTETEQNYAQIEKEMYAITFGCERFHQYVYGRKVTVETDHKPLEAINKKPLSAAPARLQRMMLRVQKYDQLNIVFKPGKQIPVADTLSRNFVKSTSISGSLQEMMNAQVHLVVSNTCLSDRKMNEMKTATGKDPQMQLLAETILKGWPDAKRKCPGEIADYWNIRDELSVMEDVIFKGDRIVVPKALRAEMLFRIHIGHLGIEKCRQRARQCLYWPGMNTEIDKLVSACKICQERRSSNPREPMIPTPIPSRPWQIVGTDLFEWEGQDYLSLVDYYSRWIEIKRLNSKTSPAVIKKVKELFVTHGIPNRVISDNGPQYASAEFENFAEKWDFQHVTSSPTHAQSNGLSEKSVQIAKRILNKAKASRSDPYEALLEYRNTPVDNFATPAQLLMSRRLRAFVPVMDKQLEPKVIEKEQFLNIRKEQKAVQKRNYDHHASKVPLKPLESGESVRIQSKNGLWKPAEVVSVCDPTTPRSYIVKTGEGAVLRRNRKHLLNDNTENDSDAMLDNTPTAEEICVDSSGVSNSASPVADPSQKVSSFGRIIKTRKPMDL